MTEITYDVDALEKLRVEVGVWAKRNFGATLPEENSQAYGMLRCVAGMTEELSEMLRCGYGLLYRPQDRDAYLDGIADVCIYALDFCSVAGLKMRDVLLYENVPSIWEMAYFIRMGDRVTSTSLPVLHEGLSVLIGELAHCSLKMCQNIRRTEDHETQIKMSMCHVWRCCHCLSAYMGEDLSRLVHATVEKVLRRDWVNNPDDAYEVADANS